MSNTITDEPTNPKFEKLDKTAQWLTKLLRSAAKFSDSAARAAATIEKELIEEYLERTGSEEGEFPSDLFDKSEFQSIVDRLVQVSVAKRLIHRLNLKEIEEDLLRAIIQEVFRSRVAGARFVSASRPTQEEPGYYGDDLGFLTSMMARQMQSKPKKG